MSSNDQLKPSLTAASHPADDSAQVDALRLALALFDLPVARSIGREVLDKRIAWERREHPTGRGACDPEEPSCCDGCAAAYAAADARDIEEESETTQ